MLDLGKVIPQNSFPISFIRNVHFLSSSPESVFKNQINGKHSSFLLDIYLWCHEKSPNKKLCKKSPDEKFNKTALLMFQWKEVKSTHKTNQPNLVTLTGGLYVRYILGLFC